MMEIPKKGSDDTEEDNKSKEETVENLAKKGDKDFKEIQKKLGEKIKELEKTEYYILGDLKLEKDRGKISQLNNELKAVREALEDRKTEYIKLIKSSGEEN